jgi:DNA adenine methylase
MYLDPPYILGTRKNRKMYKVEMTDDDHIRLCTLIDKSPAKIILSGYANEIYETRLKNFRKTKITAYDEKGNRRVEILWHNYAVTRDMFEDDEASMEQINTDSGLRPPCAAERR